MSETDNSTDKLKEELNVAVDAAIGIIAIRAPQTEIFRVQDAIYSLASDQETNFRSWMISHGWVLHKKIDKEHSATTVFDPLDKDVQSDKTSVAIAAAMKVLQHGTEEQYPQEGFYVMLDAHYFFDDPAFVSAIRNQSHRALTVDQRLFIIVPDHVPIPDGLASLMYVIDVVPPNREELEESLGDILGQIDEEARPEFDPSEVLEIIANSAGMTKTAFDTATSLAITEYSNENDGAAGINADVFLNKIREFKTSILKKTNVLELCSNVSMDDVGGLENIKEWLNTRSRSFQPEAIEFGITPSRGCLLVGPPGTAKSLLAKASGDVLSLPTIRFDIGRVFGSFIGQSEQQMRTVLKMIDEMSPCVLFVDEIDKGFAGMSGGGGTDSGTSARVFGTFLTWMQERDQFKRPVFLVLTANRVTGLPPELLRRGRIDEIWHIGLPNVVERAAILKIHLAKRDHGDDLSEDELLQATVQTEGLVGAEIESLVEATLNRDFSLGNKKATLDSLVAERATLKPMSVSFGAQITEMESWARINARPASPKETEVAKAAAVGKTVSRPGVRKIRLDKKRGDA